jgi:hypothetical protein
MNAEPQTIHVIRNLPPRELPAEFFDLSIWVADWALPDERQRMARLLRASVAELRLFYDAMLARMPAVKGHLDQFPLESLPPPSQTLFDLAMTFMETAHVIDLDWKTTDIEDKFPHDRFLVKSPF